MNKKFVLEIILVMLAGMFAIVIGTLGGMLLCYMDSKLAGMFAIVIGILAGMLLSK